jgi:hypothetical protein
MMATATPSISTMRAGAAVLKPQRADSTEVVHRQQEVELGEFSQARIHFAALGVLAQDDPATPRIRCCVGHSEVKAGV